MAEPSETTQAPPQLSTQQQLDALTRANNISPKELADASGQGMNPSGVSTVTARVTDVVQSGVASLDHKVEQISHIVNGPAPITQGIVTLANDQVKPREGYTTVIDRPDGIYMPGVGDRLAARQAAGPANLSDQGLQPMPANVQHMLASANICNQISGASFVATTCVGGLSPQQHGGPQVSVGVAMRF